MNLSRVISQTKIKWLEQSFQNKNMMPKNIEFVEESNGVWVANIYDSIDKDTTIHESVQTGIATNKNTAYLKALSERVERFAYREGYSQSLPACITERSDGFAAFPYLFFKRFAKSKARINALGEATERYAWSKWWDNKTASSTEEILPRRNLITDLCFSENNIEKIILVQPKIANSPYKLAILIAFFKGGGCTSGGAASYGLENAIFRGGSELLRHIIASNRLIESKSAASFYEERLLFFRHGLGDKLLEERVNSKNLESIQLPELKFDDEIPHKLSGCYVVHRCLFEDQPTFMGGDLARLCV